jgi:hypothetical protein
MKNILNRSILFCFVLLVGCTKHTTSADNTIAVETPVVVTTQPSIKFFNVMDFAATNVFLNSKQVSSVAKFYASSYLTAKEGVNNIQIAFPNKNTLLNVNPILALNTKYSCFFYKVGYDWKYSLVKDDLPTNLTTGTAALRVLDFRTEAYYNYINVRLISPGSDIIDQKNRNFLDHVTYSGYSNFKTITSGTYSIKMYNDTLTTSQRLGVNFDSKGIYSIILTTPGNITPYSNAIFYIYPDVAKHN